VALPLDTRASPPLVFLEAATRFSLAAMTLFGWTLLDVTIESGVLANLPGGAVGLVILGTLTLLVACTSLSFELRARRGEERPRLSIVWWARLRFPSLWSEMLAPVERVTVAEGRDGRLGLRLTLQGAKARTPMLDPGLRPEQIHRLAEDLAHVLDVPLEERFR
jgi:hypothetical protein